MYRKRCLFCGKEFSGPSRNLRYCSDPKCIARREALSKRKQHRKSVYRRNIVEFRAMALARAAARKTAESILQSAGVERKCCFDSCAETDPKNLELHHRNGNPFDIHPSNLEWLCTVHHPVVQKELDAMLAHARSFFKAFTVLVQSDNNLLFKLYHLMEGAGVEYEGINKEGDTNTPSVEQGL